MHKETHTYSKFQGLTEQEILQKAAEILEGRIIGEDIFDSPQASRNYLKVKLGAYEREVFSMLLLDNQHRLIEYQELFFGTIDSATVYPREVVKEVLIKNAAAVIFAHNHPSGCNDPSQADRRMTNKLIDALKLIDVRVLDHFVVGTEIVSFAEQAILGN